jgi:cytochrome c oxidase assembly protein subunit 15
MKLTTFQKTAIATVIATVVLIFIGGLVRATGSGLGCPDWPRCWGSWWPPSGVEEIVTKTDSEGRAYYEGHHAYRAADGTREPKRHYVSEFNKAKLWTEYGNRLVGVLIGLFVFATWVQSFRFLKRKPTIFWGSFAAFILVGFQGWLGGMVVRSGLMPGMITLHMVVAIVLMALLLWVAFRSVENQLHAPVEETVRGTVRKAALVLFVLTVAQIVLGSQVREALHDVEHASEVALARGEWIGQVGWLDHVHRAFSWTVLLGSGFLLRTSFKVGLPSVLRRPVRIIFVLVMLQIIYGVALAYFGLPPVFQILHLGFASLMVCAEIFLVLASARPCES